MRIPRRDRRTQPSDGIPPRAIPAPRRRQPSAPLYGMDRRVDDALSFDLPAEDPHLLTARAVDVDQALGTPMVVRRRTGRSRCRILKISRTEFEFEVVVGQNLAMLADQEHAEVTR